jgi:hypothetical protein
MPPKAETKGERLSSDEDKAHYDAAKVLLRQAFPDEFKEIDECVAIYKAAGTDISTKLDTAFSFFKCAMDKTKPVWYGKSCADELRIIANQMKVDHPGTLFGITIYNNTGKKDGHKMGVKEEPHVPRKVLTEGLANGMADKATELGYLLQCATCNKALVVAENEDDKRPNVAAMSPTTVGGIVLCGTVCMHNLECTTKRDELFRIRFSSIIPPRGST